MQAPSQRRPQHYSAPRQTQLEPLTGASCNDEEDELTCKLACIGVTAAPQWPRSLGVWSCTTYLALDVWLDAEKCEGSANSRWVMLIGC